VTTQTDVARAYLDALISHDAQAVRFADNAVRYENGIKTGRSGKHLTRSLSRGPQYRVVQSIRELETSVDSDVVHTEYLLDAGLFGRKLATVRVVEDFVIPADDLLIHRIDAKIKPRR